MLVGWLFVCLFVLTAFFLHLPGPTRREETRRDGPSVALIEGPSLAPSIHIKQLTTAYRSSSRDSNTLLWTLDTKVSCIQRTYIHNTYTKMQIKYLKGSFVMEMTHTL